MGVFFNRLRMNTQSLLHAADRISMAVGKAFAWLIVVLMLAHFFLAQALTGRDEALGRLNSQIAQLTDMLSLERHVRLQVESFGRLSEQLDDYTTRGIEKLLGTPRGRELIGFVAVAEQRLEIQHAVLQKIAESAPLTETLDRLCELVEAKFGED